MALLLARCGGVDLSGTGVETFVGGCDTLLDGRLIVDDPGVSVRLLEAVLR